MAVADRSESVLPARAHSSRSWRRSSQFDFTSASRAALVNCPDLSDNFEIGARLAVDDIRAELRGRPYEFVSVAGGWMFRTKLRFGDAIRTALGGPQKAELSKSNALILMAIGYFQPITRGELSQFFGREVSRDAIASLRGEGFIAAGPRSPTPGAPYAYVTTPAFLAQFGFESLRDLPDIETLEDAGLLGRTSDALPDGAALASELKGVLGLSDDENLPEEDAAKAIASASVEL